MENCILCNKDFEPIVPTCERELLSGGLAAVGFLKCSSTLDITDPADLATAIANGDAISTPCGEITGSVPEAEDTMFKTDDCAPERVIGRKHTVNWFDYNSQDMTIGFGQDIFYNNIDRFYRYHQFFYLTCDGRMYGPVKKYSLTLKRPVETDGLTGKTFWMGTVAFHNRYHLVPVYMPTACEILDPAIGS